MERIDCLRLVNPNSDCNPCPVAVKAAVALADRRSQPTNRILLEVAHDHCPEGLSPKISGDPLLLIDGKSRSDRAVSAGAEAVI